MSSWQAFGKESKLKSKYSLKTFVDARAALDALVPKCGMPLYSSIDIRDSGDKIVAVDVNLFPAGFNNLSPHSWENASQEFKKFFELKLKNPGPWKIGLLPESHTNNEGYLRNVLALIHIFEKAGAEIKLAWTGIPIPKKWTLKVGESQVLEYLPASEVTAWADALVLNHDLSGGLLESLKDFQKKVFPSPELGWYKRQKSEHFEIARKVLARVATKADIDPEDFIAKANTVGDLDFDKKEDIERLLHEAASFYDSLKGSSEDPFVYVKNDSGTYGLGVWSFGSLEELRGATKLIQKKFQRGKQGAQVKRVILQEGVRTRFITSEPDNNIEFEPVVYSVNGKRVGVFLRCGFSDQHQGELNLNKPGSWFEDESRIAEELSDMKELYCFVTQLHSVTAAIEDCPCEQDFS